MDKKYLFVGEYDDSYTGGGVVFISTKEFLDQFKLNGLKIIQDKFQIQLRTLRQFPSGTNNEYNGISVKKFWNLVKENDFDDDFIKWIKSLLDVDTNDMNNRYPGYNHNKNIRPDWFPENKKGIYIVYEKEIEDESEDVVIISDTYYCA